MHRALSDFMQKKKEINLDYAAMLSKLFTGKIKYKPLYEKAFLNREEPPASEYNQNTTTWD